MQAYNERIITHLPSKIKVYFRYWEKCRTDCAICTKNSRNLYVNYLKLQSGKTFKKSIDFLSVLCYNSRALCGSDGRSLSEASYSKKLLETLKKVLKRYWQTPSIVVEYNSAASLGSMRSKKKRVAAVLENWTTDEKVQSTRSQEKYLNWVWKTISYNSF